MSMTQVRGQAPATRILPDQSQDAQAVIARLTAELEALKASQSKGRGLTLAVSDEAGVVMILGLRSRPICYYAEEWLKIAQKMPDLMRFIASNPVSKTGTPMSVREGVTLNVPTITVG